MSVPFHADQLRSALKPFVQAEAVRDQAQAYQRYYGVELSAQRAGLHSRLGVFEAAGYRLVAQAWWGAEPRATLVLLHGYYDHMGLYRHLIEWALEMGYAVISCDLPGHGLSEGPRASINEFAEYQAALQGLLQQAELLDLPQPWHLCGQSTGGAIIADYLLHQPQAAATLGRSILLAPLVRPRAWGWSKLTYQVMRHFVEAIPRRFSDNSSDQQFLQFLLNQDPLQPRTLPTAWVGALSRWVPHIEAAPVSMHQPLIVQGDADMTVDWQHNLKVLNAKFNAPQVLMVPSAKHHLANETAPLRQRYFDFLREQLA